MDTQLNVLSTRRGFREVRLPKSQQGSNRGFPLLRGKTVILHWGSEKCRRRRRPPCAAAAARRRRKFVPGQLDEENPFVKNSSVLLVQADEGVSVLVVDRIGDIYRILPRRADVIVTTVGARHKCQQGSGFEPPMYVDNCYLRIDRLPAVYSLFFRCLAGGRIRIPNITISRWFESSSRKIPAGSLYIQTQERSDVVEEEIQLQATVHQQMSQDIQSQYLKIQQKQLKNVSAAKQLTIYESWMSTAERNSNGKNAQDGKNQWLRLSRANCLNSREQDLYYSGKQYNLQRMFARIWKEDKLAISSAEQIWNLSSGHISNRAYIFEKLH
ncbi:phosphomethylethanolamine N-methyltransferase [Dorcoceras hygrometricum]|uniref:Phosphomethylethanolamine N-methyltransferase n=1 Tax=Dorcoceras hygrometricum TaxID=472368 RepID=A0A2Z7D879_9LAMI|nr:phosphomethylethanolamine N-methyltransferase [Dorcoceras hygrometricum]